MRKRNSNGKKDAPVVIATAREPVDATPSPKGQDDALQAKNYKLAKELSDVRVRQREESKNVTRLTMENMNLASRCREAIAQAASLKKDLVAQKRKTVEAVSQTHQLLSELKKMKNSSPERKSRRQQEGETPSIVTEATTILNSITDDASKSPESISTKSTVAPLPSPVEDLSDLDEPPHHDTSTANGLVSSDDYEPPGQVSPPRPDAPSSFEDDSEEQDTVADTIPDKPPSFPIITASPQVVRRFPGVKETGSYDEEYPSDLSCQSTKTTNQSLLSSIDAFEASFKTSFPKSFTPKEGDEQNVAYDPFDTNSPQKRMMDHKGISDPPGDHNAPNSPSRIDRSPRDTVPKEGGRKVPSLDDDKIVESSNSRNVKSVDQSTKIDSPTQIAGERLADRFQQSLDAANKRMLKSEEAVSPQNRTATESMVSRLKKNLTSQGSPTDENFILSKTKRSSGGNSKLVSPSTLAEDQRDPFHLTPLSPTLVPVDLERSPRNAAEEDPIDPLDKYQVALRKDVPNDARRTSQQSISAPRGFSPDQHNFATTRAQYERTASRRQNDGEIPMQSSIPTKARVTRSWQRPKALLLAGDDDDDDNGTFRQRRNVNLSKVAARRADFGGGAPSIVVSPKTLGR